MVSGGYVRGPTTLARHAHVGFSPTGWPVVVPSPVVKVMSTERRVQLLGRKSTLKKDKNNCTKAAGHDIKECQADGIEFAFGGPALGHRLFHLD